MARGDHTFAIALGVSLIAHAILLPTAIKYQPTFAGFPPIAAPQNKSSIYVDDRPDASLGFGAADGKGNAANASPGEEPMVGRDADQVQAFLSRDPVGPGRVGDDPSMSVLPVGGGGVPAKAQAAIESAPMLGVASASNDAPSAHKLAFANTSKGQDQTSLVRTKNSQVASADDSSPEASTPGAPQPAADPAVMSDSESDPFAPGMKVEFRDGRVDVRLGRKVKTVRPKLNLAAIYDLQSTSFPTMTVKVHIDAEGAVRDVDIVKSSGSNGADQAVKVALYQWWFEPAKDAAGHAIASEVTFPITWH